MQNVIHGPHNVAYPHQRFILIITMQCPYIIYSSQTTVKTYLQDIVHQAGTALPRGTALLGRTVGQDPCPEQPGRVRRPPGGLPGGLPGVERTPRVHPGVERTPRVRPGVERNPRVRPGTAHGQPP